MATYVVTGASCGIGLELCKQILAADATNKVYATVRAKENSSTKEDLISPVVASSGGRLTVLEGIDISKDDVGVKLKAGLEGVTIDVLIHNAGSLSGHAPVREGAFAAGDVGGIMGGQSLGGTTMDAMRACFEVNTLGPLRVQQALTAQMRSPGGKVGILSTGMGSIGDNGSGGVVPYRTSKAAVNMVGKCMSCDLKKQEISVALINPGGVFTEFAPDAILKNIGAKPVDVAVRGVLKVLANLTLETSGSGLIVAAPTDGSEPKPMPW